MVELGKYHHPEIKVFFMRDISKELSTVIYLQQFDAIAKHILAMT